MATQECLLVQSQRRVLSERQSCSPLHSATTTGQKLVVKADFVIAPLARSSLDEQIVDIGAAFDLPTIGRCTVGMALADKPLSAPIATMVDFLRTSFDGY